MFPPMPPCGCSFGDEKWMISSPIIHDSGCGSTQHLRVNAAMSPGRGLEEAVATFQDGPRFCSESSLRIRWSHFECLGTTHAVYEVECSNDSLPSHSSPRRTFTSIATVFDTPGRRRIRLALRQHSKETESSLFHSVSCYSRSKNEVLDWTGYTSVGLVYTTDTKGF